MWGPLPNTCSAPHKDQTPALPPTKTRASGLPSLPAALGGLSPPLDSWLDTGKKIPPGSVLTGLLRSAGQCCPSLPTPRSSSHPTWWNLCAAAPPQRPDSTSEEDPPLPPMSPAPQPPHQEFRAAFQALDGSRSALRGDV